MALELVTRETLRRDAAQAAQRTEKLVAAVFNSQIRCHEHLVFDRPERDAVEVVVDGFIRFDIPRHEMFAHTTLQGRQLFLAEKIGEELARRERVKMLADSRHEAYNFGGR